MPVIACAHKNTQYWIDCAHPQKTTKSIHSTATITQLLFEYGRIITADDTGVILVFSTDGKLKLRLRGHKYGVWCLATTKTKLVSGSEDKTIRIWNLLSGHCTQVFRGHTGVVRCLQIVRPEYPMDPEPDLPPDQQSRQQPIRPLIVSGSRDGSVRVWTLPRLTESEYGHRYKDGPLPDPDPDENPYHLYHFTGHNGPVRCIAANRKTVLSGGEDGTVRAYDMKAKKLLNVLQGHTAKITSVAIDPCLRSWYSASLDGQIRLWNSRNGNCLAVCTQHTAGVTLMFNTPWRIVTAGEDGLAMTWSATTGVHIRAFSSGDGDYLVDLRGDDYKILTCTEASAKMWTPQDGKLVRTLHRCVGKEKLSHVAFEFQQCAITYKDSQGRNMLAVVDFRPPETRNEWLYPSNDSLDSDEEANPTA